MADWLDWPDCFGEPAQVALLPLEQDPTVPFLTGVTGLTDWLDWLD